MTRLTIGIGFLGLALLSGCAVTEPKPLTHTPEFAPVYPVQQAQPRPATGAIFDATRADSWFGRSRNYRVGDVITVILDESLQAGRSRQTDISRAATNGTATGDLSNQLTKAGTVFSGIDLSDNEITSAGSGTSDQAANLQGSIAVTVVNVLANGNLILRGEKQLQMSEGNEIIQVSGIVRPDDIAPNFTVLSRRLANAQISYRGEGGVNDASKPGWGTTLLMKAWPF